MLHRESFVYFSLENDAVKSPNWLLRGLEYSTVNLHILRAGHLIWNEFHVYMSYSPSWHFSKTLQHLRGLFDLYSRV